MHNSATGGRSSKWVGGLALAAFIGIGAAHSVAAPPVTSATFDGTTAGLALPDGANLLGRDIGVIRLRVAADVAFGKGPILTLVGYQSSMAVGFSDDDRSLVLSSLAGDVTLTPDGFKDAARHVIALQLVRGSGPADEGHWVVSIDGQQVGIGPGVTQAPLAGAAVARTVPTGLIPEPDERVSLTLGGAGFKGVIDQYEVRTPDNLLYSNLTSKGQIVRRAVPVAGAYLAVDANIGIEQADLTPAFDHDHHGVFKKPTYFGLAHVPAWLDKRDVTDPDDLLLAVDWGPSVVFRPNLDDPNLYSPRAVEDVWVGDLRFSSDDEATSEAPAFCSSGYRGAATRPFLRDGECYVGGPRAPKERYIGGAEALAIAGGAQNVFLAGGHGIPPNFTFSEQGCFDTANLDLANLQDTGCHGNRIFKAQMDEGGQFSVMPPYIVPKGWIYVANASSEKKAHSAVTANGEELATAYAGNESQGFTVLGYSASQNRKSADEFSVLTQRKQMRAVHQFFARNHSLVLDPEAVTLDECFIYDVLRASTTEFAAARSVSPSSLPNWAMPSGPAYFDIDKARHDCRGRGSLTKRLTAQDLIARYGSHYANAITYGSRTIEDVDFASSTVRTMVSGNEEFADSKGFQFEANLSIGAGSEKGPHAGLSVPLKIGDSDESTTTTGSSNKSEQTIEGEFVGAICYGAPCAQGLPQQGDAAIPVYLDLARLDYLLAPPFFLDPMVLALLRPAVARELDRARDAEQPNLLRSLRVVDVELVGAPQCLTGAANATLRLPDPETGPSTYPDYCGSIVDRMMLVAFVTKPGGGFEAVRPVGLPERARPNEVVGGPDSPSRLSNMNQCADPSAPTAGCGKRQFRFVFDIPNGAIPEDAVIGFMLVLSNGLPSQFGDLIRSYDGNSACGQSCAGGVWAVQWPTPDRNVFLNMLPFRRNRETPENLSGQAFVETDASKNKIFAVSLNLALRDSLDAALGYPGLVVKQHRGPPILLDTINPNTTPTLFPWLAADGLMLDGSHDLTGPRNRCERSYGGANCVRNGDGYASMPPNARIYPSPDERG